MVGGMVTLSEWPTMREPKGWSVGARERSKKRGDEGTIKMQ